MMAIPPTTQYSPSSTRYDLQAGLAARVHDPLWMLLRQWQMGEFYGEDAGTPVQVVIDHDSFAPDRVVTATRAFDYKPSDAPLEALVERESRQRAEPDLRTRSQWGLLLFDFFSRANLITTRNLVLKNFGFSVADQSKWASEPAAVQLLIRRAPDSEAMYRAFFNSLLEDARLVEWFAPPDPSTYPEYRQAIHEWVAAYEARTGRLDNSDAWLTDRLEYSFSLEVPTDNGKVTLSAPEYHGGRLDWDAFRVQSADQVNRGTPVRTHRRDTVLPTPVTYAGMPAPRFWEIEDGSVDFGNPEASEHDLGRLLLAEFAMSWGNDWFMVPVEVNPGSLCRINELLVTDTFGITTRISPHWQQAPHWSLCHLGQRSGTPSQRQFLFVPPVLPSSHESPKIEEVLFLRDEMANVAWAIEQVVADGLGRPQPVVEQSPRGVRGVERLRDGHQLLYQPITDLPEHWIPMVPVRDTVSNAHFLMKAGLRDDLGLEVPEPKGWILRGTTEFVRVHDEEIPRDGAEVSRTWQVARWYDGSRSVWVGRRKRAGTGEIRSHLEFDALVDASM
jgi:hypothetical protein